MVHSSCCIINSDEFTNIYYNLELNKKIIISTYFTDKNKILYSNITLYTMESVSTHIHLVVDL